MHLQERRQKPRVIVGPEFFIQFTIQGHTFQKVQLANLSEDGCFATVSGSPAGLFTAGARLENLVLAHPDLPQVPLTGQVAYALGGEGMEFLGLGIHFVEMAPEVAQSLKDWVARHA
jgi:hypothetical protein